jgi:hypothetical protein
MTTKKELTIDNELSEILEGFMGRIEECLIRAGGEDGKAKCVCGKEKAITEIKKLFEGGLK